MDIIDNLVQILTIRPSIVYWLLSIPDVKTHEKVFRYATFFHTFKGHAIKLRQKETLEDDFIINMMSQYIWRVDEVHRSYVQ